MNKKIVKEIDLIPIVKLNINQKLQILSIRNMESVRKWMYTDHVISEREHLQWIESLQNNERDIVWGVLDDKNVVGVVSVNSIDNLHLRAEWAFYLSDVVRGGLGSCLEYCLLEYVFEKLKIEKLNCEVIEGNDAVIKLHQKFFFEIEGFRKENIIKEKERKGIHLLGITKNKWLENKEGLYNKYSRILDKFLINL